MKSPVHLVEQEITCSPCGARDHLFTFCSRYHCYWFTCCRRSPVHLLQ